LQLPVLSAGKLEESGAMIKVGLAELGELPTPTLDSNCHLDQSYLNTGPLNYATIVRAGTKSLAIFSTRLMLPRSFGDLFGFFRYQFINRNVN
jgi:hypothetical protein